MFVQKMLGTDYTILRAVRKKQEEVRFLKWQQTVLPVLDRFPSTTP
jgi:hypothetical protein